MRRRPSPRSCRGREPTSKRILSYVRGQIRGGFRTPIPFSPTMIRDYRPTTAAGRCHSACSGPDLRPGPHVRTRNRRMAEGASFMVDPEFSSSAWILLVFRRIRTPSRSHQSLRYAAIFHAAITSASAFASANAISVPSVRFSVLAWTDSAILDIDAPLIARKEVATHRHATDTTVERLEPSPVGCQANWTRRRTGPQTTTPPDPWVRRRRCFGIGRPATRRPHSRRGPLEVAG